MSENKYIIDKDSLTGIADAVRDKLGNGKAITDENAGYYPATGYVLKFYTIQKAVRGKGTNVIFSISNWNEQFKTWCGKVPEKIKFIRTSNPSYTTVYCNGAVVIPGDGGSFAEKIISYPTNGKIVVTEYNGYNSFAVTPPAIKIEFLDNDENSLGIINGDTSFSYDGQTISFLTGSYNTAIPFTLNDIQNKITNYLEKKSGLIYRYYINPQNNESGTAFLGTPLSEMNVLDYGVTSVSQIKFMLIYGYSSSGAFTWYPSQSTNYTMIINGKPFYASDSSSVYWPNYTSDNRNSYYKLQLCPSKLSSWPLGIMRGTTSSYMSESSLQNPRIVFMVLDLEATE